MYLIGAIFFLLPLEIFSFNIDTDHFIVYVDPQKNENSNFSADYFGYTVLLSGDKGLGKWVKIGAPKGQDPNINKFTHTGVVYNCPLFKKCETVDVTGGNFQKQEILTDAWIGGSMDISYKFQRYSICGFRALYKHRSDKDPLGSCYLIYINRTDQITPLDNTNKRLRNGVYYYMLGQAGFSSHFPQDENSLILGAPGLSNWAGTLIKVTDVMRDDPIASRLTAHRTKRYVETQPYVAQVDIDVSASFELLGYSVTSGYFFGKKKLYYATGTPKFNRYVGKVAIVEFDNENPLKQKKEIVGNQFGEYFGASLASGDLNLDGFDDIIVGAPYHTEDSYNEGAVYIYLGTSKNQLRKHYTLHGQKANGLFGSALMFLGDINDDSFGDLAIGAPYEEEFSGVLYIYKGNKEGIDPQPCQRIIGKHIFPEIKGFGISISRPADMDDNDYKDLVVGAYLSGNAVLLRTRPVVVVKYSMNSFPVQLKKDTSQFVFRICFSYSRLKENMLALNRTIVVDEHLKRAYLKNGRDGVKTITVRKSTRDTCENITISLEKTTNYVDPIKISVSYTLKQQQIKKEVVYVSDKDPNGRKTFSKLSPILDEFRSSQPSSLLVPFTLDCGSDNKCHSKLTIDAKFPDLKTNNTFVLGSEEYLNIEAVVKNTGEHAYSTQVEVTLPDIINFRQIPAECTEQNVSVIICNVGSPVRQNETKGQMLNIDMKRVNQNKKLADITISIKVMTTSINNNPNKRSFTLSLIREVGVSISGESNQQSVVFSSLTEDKPNFTQIYKIQKEGASLLEQVQVNITLPHLIKTPRGMISFISLFQPTGTLAGQRIDCQSNFKYIAPPKSVEMSNKLDSDMMISRRKRQVEVFKEMEKDDKKNIVIEEDEYVVTSNRIQYLNCSAENIVCSSIVCTVGPFEKSKLPAVIQIKMMLDLPTITRLLGEKDIIYFLSQGTATIQFPTEFVKTGNGSDFVEVSSLLINESVRRKKVAIWIIILAIIAGILLLALLVYGLTKLGFFKREKKEELESLKAAAQQVEENETHPESSNSAPETFNEDTTINSSTEGLVDEHPNENFVLL